MPRIVKGGSIPTSPGRTSKTTPWMTDEDSELAKTVAEMRKRFGDNAVLIARSIPQPGRISTGIFVLDLALLGGVPDNRITMAAGRRSAGKSTLANMVVAGAQRKYPDKCAIWIDVEGTYDPTWGAALGVDIDAMPVVPCETGEMAADVAEAMVCSAETSLVVVDSIAALTPMKEVEASSEDQFVGMQARLVGAFVRKVTSALISERRRGHFVTVLFLNQYRSKIGGYGDPRVLPGGQALEFCTTVQIDIKNKEKDGNDSNGVQTILSNEHAFTITKNKMNAGPRAGEFVLVRDYNEATGLYPGEVDDAATVLAFAKKFGAYTGGGARWTVDFDDTRRSFGKAAETVQALREDREFYWGLRTHCIRMQAIKLGMPTEFIESIV